MTEELRTAVEAMRVEFQRQAAAGNATYHGVATDGLDGLEGYFDLVAVAQAALAVTRPAPPPPSAGEDVATVIPPPGPATRPRS